MNKNILKITTILSSIILLPTIVGAETYTTNKGAGITTNEGPLIYEGGESEYKNISVESVNGTTFNKGVVKGNYYGADYVQKDNSAGTDSRGVYNDNQISGIDSSSVTIENMKGGNNSNNGDYVDGSTKAVLGSGEITKSVEAQGQKNNLTMQKTYTKGEGVQTSATVTSSDGTSTTYTKSKTVQKNSDGEYQISTTKENTTTGNTITKTVNNNGLSVHVADGDNKAKITATDDDGEVTVKYGKNGGAVTTKTKQVSGSPSRTKSKTLKNGDQVSSTTSYSKGEGKTTTKSITQNDRTIVKTKNVSDVNGELEVDNEVANLSTTNYLSKDRDVGEKGISTERSEGTGANTYAGPVEEKQVTVKVKPKGEVAISK